MEKANVGFDVGRNLDEAHLDALLDLAESAVADHCARACSFKEGWQGRVRERLKAELPALLGQMLEDEEAFCPQRGIGVKEAA